MITNHDGTFLNLIFIHYCFIYLLHSFFDFVCTEDYWEKGGEKRKATLALCVCLTATQLRLLFCRDWEKNNRIMKQEKYYLYLPSSFSDLLQIRQLKETRLKYRQFPRNYSNQGTKSKAGNQKRFRGKPFSSQSRCNYSWTLVWNVIFPTAFMRTDLWSRYTLLFSIFSKNEYSIPIPKLILKGSSALRAQKVLSV